jgi:hypothetical protein
MLLKKVPDHINLTLYRNLSDDPRWVFFQNQGERQKQGAIIPHIYIPSGENNTKYYYRRIGDQLEPLGKFTKLELEANQHLSGGWKGHNEYTISFDRQQIISAAGDELYYTYEPPAAGSVPLTINDIPNIKGGKKYKKYRKNTKKYRKNTKKYRKTINKKRRLK